MKPIIVSLLMVLISTHLNSQVISFYIDTVHNFTHPVGMDALEAFRNNKLDIVTSSISDKGPIQLITDLNNKKVIFNGYEDPIVSVEESNLLYSIKVNDNDWICNEYLARTEDEKQFIYIFEFEINGLMDGFIWVGDKSDVCITK
ncbi:MAG: hypothetical protein ACKOW8_03410 [Flavobacteriales bacterium]